MNKKKNVQGAFSSLLTSGNISRQVTANNAIDTKIAIDLPTDEYVKKIIATGKKKVFLNETLYMVTKGNGITLVLKKNEKEEIIFSASETNFNNEKTKIIYELIKDKLKPIENLLKKRWWSKNDIWRIKKRFWTVNKNL